MGRAIEASLLTLLLLLGAPLLLVAGTSGHPGMSGALDWLGDCWFALRAGEAAVGLVLLAALGPGALAAFRMLRELVTRWALLASLRREVSGTAQPPDLSELAQSLGLRRVVYVDRPDVFAFTQLSEVVVSRGLVELLPREELKAVLLHERYHLIRRSVKRGLWVAGLTAATAFLPVAPLLQRAWWLREELDADRAAAVVGGDVVALALLRLARHAHAESAPNAEILGSSLALRVQAVLGQPAPLFEGRSWRAAVVKSALILAALSLVPLLLHAAPLEWHLRDWLPHGPGQSC
ncbi:M48 family metalloprotease [Meiothermus hypogaeus]|uniref:Peptidase M48 domain-containing protein n=2 Tax=Meiothermus hypogaeus TaxID=884155 RepID=A0A511QYZ3_9DEIN|nr:M48 family metalloprotease [Meiothermus hypogaeus]RIH80402.1 Protease HtpX [Meiothermus hypogaeus]GEM82595.1 hypothetical protein MHY01S_07610 [Meiothermus hypogaeus NBRC 106114]